MGLFASQSMNQSKYINLLKKTLTFSLWEKSYIDPMVFDYPWHKRLFLKILSSLISINKNYALVRVFHTKDHPAQVQAHTMLYEEAINNLQFCVEDVLKNNIRGDFIEAGVWRGGACIFMKGILEAFGVKDRKIFVADSFAGLPKPDRAEDENEVGSRYHTYKFLVASLEEVRGNFEKYDLLDDGVIFLKGWFKDTLNDPRIEKLALIRLDGDMYGSTMDVMSHLYPKLSKGGYCIIDDWNLPDARRAVFDYLKENNFAPHIVEFTKHAYWKKI